jgi:hypothetical protein
MISVNFSDLKQLTVRQSPPSHALSGVAYCLVSGGERKAKSSAMMICR